MKLQITEQNQWKELLSKHFGLSVYQDWLQQLQFSGFDKGVLTLTAPSLFVRDWICRNYLEAIETLFLKTLEGFAKITIEVDCVLPQGDVSSGGFFPQTSSEMSSEDESDIPSAPLDARFTFEQFVVGKPNEFAYAAAYRVAESDEATYNPLFLYGPVGHGKTHLMHSIAQAITKRSKGQKKILYLSAEKFMYYFVRALRYKNVMAFKERFRSVHVLMIDDVQFISGKESTQEEFFHTFNALVDMKRQVVISADKSPSDLDGIQERMKSRLGWGLVADLHPTTYELRLGILQSKAARLQTQVSEEIIDFLASHIISNVRELEGALTRIVAHSTLIGQPITLELAKHILKDLLRPMGRTITLDHIQKQVADHFHVRITDLHSAKRLRSIVRPRQIAMFLAKQLTSISLPAIGRYFGGRDHTTVLHAITTIERLLQTDKTLNEAIRNLKESLEN